MCGIDAHSSPLPPLPPRPAPPAGWLAPVTFSASANCMEENGGQPLALVQYSTVTVVTVQLQLQLPVTGRNQACSADRFPFLRLLSAAGQHSYHNRIIITSLYKYVWYESVQYLLLHTAYKMKSDVRRVPGTGTAAQAQEQTQMQQPYKSRNQ